MRLRLKILEGNNGMLEIGAKVYAERNGKK